jgi:outer membrane immunogenic protein
MKTLTISLIALFAGAVLALTSFAGPEPIRDYKDSKDKVIAPVPEPCNWQGFYIGLNAGGTFGNSNATDGGYNAPPGYRWSYDTSGFVGGLEAGYNLQPWKHIVLGVEGDVGYLGSNGRGAEPVSPDHDTIGTTDDGLYSTFRGRVGVAFNHVLIYATGGGILANSDVGVFDHRNVRPAGDGLGDGSSDDVRFGWTVGGGLAYAINCHWSVKAEYLYYDLGREGITFHEVVGNPRNIPFDTKTDGNIVRAGLDFKF